ncbi:hypothetical protein [Streptomyces sp. NPDC057702]|uniref:hypothetical protein n=1 Tax=unclassified Streptomyces TaxID=2593676 RepID=UPI003693B8CB
MSLTGREVVRARPGERGATGAGPTPAPDPATTVAPVTAELARAALGAALHDRYEAPFRPPTAPTPIAHPNGFVKLPLAQLRTDGRRLFLHVWQAGGEDAQIHDHRWDFAATVLAGELYNTLVEIAPDAPPAPSNPAAAPAAYAPEAYDVVRYRPRDGGFHFDAGDARRVRVTSARTHTVPAGGHYGMVADTLHRAGAAPGTLTLVARGRPVREAPRVLVRGPVTEGFRQWRYVDAAERHRHLRAALDLLG